MESNRLLSDNYIKINHIASKCMRLFIILVLVYWILTVIGGQCNFVILSCSMGFCVMLSLCPTIFIDLLKNDISKCIKYFVIAIAVAECTILCSVLSYTAMIVWLFPLLIASLYYNKTMVLYTALLSTVGVFSADIVNYRLSDMVIPPVHEDFADNMILSIAPCVFAIFLMSFVSYYIVSRNSIMLTNVIDHSSEVKTNQKELIYSFAELSESKSKSTGEHIKRVSKYMEVLGKASGFDDEYVDMLSTAAMMHDIGKLMISEEILNKPSRLTDEEYAIMKNHVLYGDALLSKCPGQILQLARTIAKEHHEKWDGSGYLHMKGEEIAYISRMMAVCDVFDALTSARYYKKGWTMEEAYTEIVNQSGKHFDPKVVLLFQAHFNEFKQIAEQNADKHIY
ncbi:MAG: HD-GYP domain-containing protein [Coprococcus sp.]|nr:HD-GYP domain-containing protein [Coprococcus sp.]